MPKVTGSTIDVLLAGNPKLQLALKNSAGKAQFSGDFDVTVASTPRRIRETLASGRFDLMILDYNLPAETGLLFFQRLRAEGFNLPKSVLVSENADEQLAAEWHRRGGDGYYSRENLTKESVERTLFDVLYTPKDIQRQRRDAYRDSATGLWGPRQLVRLLDEFLDEAGEYFQLGYSVIEVRNAPMIQEEGAVESERELLQRLGEPLEEIVGHTGYVGRYWGTMFWTLFRNDQVEHLSETLNEVVDAFGRVLTVETLEMYAGGVRTMDPASDIKQLQESIDKALFKARKARGSNVILGQL